jgi:hypothetical protein
MTTMVACAVFWCQWLGGGLQSAIGTFLATEQYIFRLVGVQLGQAFQKLVRLNGCRGKLEIERCARFQADRALEQVGRRINLLFSAVRQSV